MPDGTLEIAIGRTPRTEALFTGAVSAPGLALEIAPIPEITRAFAPMVREGRYAVSEMAIATFLMAKGRGKPIVLLPVVLSSRFQEAALLCPVGSTLRGPADLGGKRIGVRAYSQTTGMWLRGVLNERFGLAPDAMRWITFEGAHVAEFQDPAWVSRAPDGKTLLGMLQAGEIDAAIFGTELPPGMRTVFPNPASAGEAFRVLHGFMPVNHLLVARADVAAERPDDLRALVRLLGEAGAAVTEREALRPALELAMRYCVEQSLLERAMTMAEVWAGSP